MPSYIALVHKEPGSAFGIGFPDLPGCFSAADAEEDILPNAVEALSLWFEGGEADRPIITASMDELAARFSDELTRGAYLMPVPYDHRPGDG